MLDEIQVAMRSPFAVHGNGGKSLLMRPLNMGQMLRIRDWIKNKPFRDCLEQIRGQELSDGIKTELLRDARKEGAEAADLMLEGDAASFMLNFVALEGIRFLVKLMSEEDNPGLSDAEINAFVDSNNSAEIIFQISDILRPGDSSADPSKASSQTRNSLRTRNKKSPVRSSKRSKKSSSK